MCVEGSPFKKKKQSAASSSLLQCVLCVRRFLFYRLFSFLRRKSVTEVAPLPYTHVRTQLCVRACACLFIISSAPMPLHLAAVSRTLRRVLLSSFLRSTSATTTAIFPVTCIHSHLHSNSSPCTIYKTCIVRNVRSAHFSLLSRWW